MSSKTLKIGFVFDDSLDSSDGVAQYVKTLGTYFNSKGHEVRYLVGQTKMEHWSGGSVYSLAKNTRVSFNGNRLSIPLPASRKRIAEVLDSEQFDILHVQMPYSPFMAQHVVREAGAHVAVVGTFHILPAHAMANLGSRFLRILYGTSLKRFDKVVAVSPAAAKFAKKIFRVNADIVPNAVNLEEFAKSKHEAGPYKRIVFLGRLVKRKGANELLKAFAILHETLPEVRLVLAGDGSGRARLENFIRDRGLDNVVEFLGFIEEKEKPSLLASADVACFPSLYGESFGIVLIEAMAAGAKVVLGGNNAGYRSVLGERPELLVDPKDSSVFAERLVKLLSDDKLADELHRWQKKHVAQYGVEVVGDKLLQVYEAAIAKRSKAMHNKP